MPEVPMRMSVLNSIQRIESFAGAAVDEAREGRTYESENELMQLYEYAAGLRESVNALYEERKQFLSASKM